MELSKRNVPVEELIQLAREALSLGKQVTMTPTGYSMLPMLRPGKDSVLLSPVGKKLKKYDVILYRRDDGRFVLHRIVKVGHTYTCRGDHQFADEQGIRHDQIIAVMVAFKRGQKQYTADAFCYRLYCRIWHYTCPVRHVLHPPLRRLWHKWKK